MEKKPNPKLLKLIEKFHKSQLKMVNDKENGINSISISIRNDKGEMEKVYEAKKGDT